MGMTFHVIVCVDSVEHIANHFDGTKTMLESGLDRMTVRRFERPTAASPFEADNFEAVPTTGCDRWRSV